MKKPQRIIGSDRIVFVFSTIVIKFPRIYFRSTFKSTKSFLRFYGFIKFFRVYFRKCGYYEYKRNLLAGIIENWGEYIFFLRNRKLYFLVPTYFSFFGFMNIQKRGKAFSIADYDFINLLAEATEDAKEIFGNASALHTFSNHMNFCIDENFKIRILDYSDKTIHYFIIQKGENLCKNFILSCNIERYERHKK